MNKSGIQAPTNLICMLLLSQQRHQGLPSLASCLPSLGNGKKGQMHYHPAPSHCLLTPPQPCPCVALLIRLVFIVIILYPDHSISLTAPWLLVLRPDASHGQLLWPQWLSSNLFIEYLPYKTRTKKPSNLKLIRSIIKVFRKLGLFCISDIIS